MKVELTIDGVKEDGKDEVLSLEILEDKTFNIEVGYSKIILDKEVLYKLIETVKMIEGDIK